MKVVLSKNIPKLGGAGDMVDVAPGYARNFLISKGFAFEATSKNISDALAKFESAKKASSKSQLKKAKIKNLLEGISVSVVSKSNKKGHLFGSVGKEEISKSIFDSKKILVDIKDIEIEHNIKTTGRHEIGIRVGVDELVKFFVDVKNN